VAYENSDKTITANNHIHSNVKGMLLHIGVIFVNSISKTHSSKGSFVVLVVQIWNYFLLKQRKQRKYGVASNDIHDKPKGMLLHIYDYHITQR
jgi:hypothetical protein